MHSVLKQMEAWRKAGRRFALARVLSTWGSAPRRPGAAMLISEESKVVGSVSGGCVEADVIEHALLVLQDGMSRRLSYGVEDDTAWAVGLSCGGKLDVWVEPFWGASGDGNEVWEGVLQANLLNQAAVLISRLRPEGAVPTLFRGMEQSAGPELATTEAVRSAVLCGPTDQSKLVVIDQEELFMHRLPKRGRAIILGAGHIAVALLRYLEVLGVGAIVVDPRAVFTDPDRFAIANVEVHTAWPQEVLPKLKLGPEDYVVLLCHDPRMDDPALQHILRLPHSVAYIGALGSRKTHAKRRARLLASSFREHEIARIKGPAGLDIGGRSPEEIALSIVAEIVQVRNGR